MSQPHRHSHAEHRGESGRALSFVLGMVLVYMAAEIAGGLLTHSLALLADAAHMMADAAALGLAIFAARMAGRAPTARHTYGFFRAEILAALVNAAALVAISIYIFVEAWQRLWQPAEVMGSWMSAVAAGGLVVNLVSLRLLHAGDDASLNVRAARLHVLTDTLGSVGAIVAGLSIWVFHWNWADPAISVGIGILVVHSAWSLFKESVAVLMEGAPGHIDVDEVRATLLQVDGVASVHDLHVWTITSGLAALSAHAVPLEGASHERLLREIEAKLHGFGIGHVTIQIEPAAHKHAHGEHCGE